MADELAARIEGVAALAEPVRRALYRYVAAQDQAVSRDQAAVAVGVPRHQAKFHLDRLVDEGLLEAEFSRPPGRSGPGAGRPSKRYRTTSSELSVSIPERRYELAGDLMATAIDESRREGVPVAEALAGAARRRGAAIGADMRERLSARPTRQQRLEAACEELTAYGYEPRQGRRCVELTSCPFHALAVEHTDLVCAMNHTLLEAAVAALDDPGLQARLVPHERHCCVVIAHP
jgi:predicted ArsR family transcriptional regulator